MAGQNLRRFVRSRTVTEHPGTLVSAIYFQLPALRYQYRDIQMFLVLEFLKGNSVRNWRNVSGDLRREFPVWPWCARVCLDIFTDCAVYSMYVWKCKQEQWNIFHQQPYNTYTKKCLRPFASHILPQLLTTKEFCDTTVCFDIASVRLKWTDCVCTTSYA